PESRRSRQVAHRDRHPLFRPHARSHCPARSLRHNLNGARRSRRRPAPYSRRRRHRSWRRRSESAGEQTWHPARRIFPFAHGRDARRCGDRSRRPSLLRVQRRGCSEARRRLPDRPPRRLLSSLRSIGPRQRASPHLVWPFGSSSGRSRFQMLRARLALRCCPGSSPEKSAPQHQRTAVKITLIDHGAGNVASVERALARISVSTERVASPEGITRANVLVLPGVGHFSALVRALDEKALRPALLDAIARGVPFLGICLGLQALYESSDEAPDLHGLGVLLGRVRTLPSQVKLPHMGWNRVQSLNGSRLLRGIATNSYFYFAHS